MIKTIIKTSLGLLTAALLAGCVYTPYPSGYYSQPTYTTTATYRCYNYNYYPYKRCYYTTGQPYYYYGNRGYDSWNW